MNPHPASTGARPTSRHQGGRSFQLNSWYKYRDREVDLARVVLELGVFQLNSWYKYQDRDTSAGA